MIFNSFSYIIFLPIVSLIYWMLPHKFRWILLLLASLIFYSVFIPKYVIVLIVVILFNFFIGVGIDKSLKKKKRDTIYLLGIVGNVFILAGFKYFNILSEFIFKYFVGHETVENGFWKILIPVGISFTQVSGFKNQ